jgi:hypothetical protein
MKGEKEIIETPNSLKRSMSSSNLVPVMSPELIRGSMSLFIMDYRIMSDNDRSVVKLLINNNE